MSSPQGTELRGTDLRMMFVGCAAWAGAVVGLAGSSTASVLAFLGIMLGASAVGVLLLLTFTSVLEQLRPRFLLVLSAVIVTCVSAVVAGFSARSYADDPVTKLAAVGQYVEVSVTVSTHLQDSATPWSSERSTSDVRTLAVIRDGVAYSSGVGLRTEFGKEHQDLESIVPGARLRLRGTLKNDDWLQPPVAGSLRVAFVEVEDQAPPWQRWASALRRAMQVAVGDQGEVGPLISGMAIGDDALLAPELKRDMLTGSLTHLTAVSGSHIAITLALLTGGLRGHRIFQAVVTLLFLVAVVVVVGPEPSVIRASLMSSLAVWGMLLRRPSAPIGLLATVLLVSVLLDPWLAVSVGFSLSVVATAGIIVLGRKIERAAKSRLPRTRIPAFVTDATIAAVAVALSAHLITLPLLALINPWLPTWGMIANLLVAPVVAPLTVLSLGAAMTAFWAPNVASVFVELASPFAKWLEYVAVRVADWPLARFPWIQGWSGAALVILATLAAVGVARLAWFLADLFRDARRRRRDYQCLSAPTDVATTNGAQILPDSKKEFRH